MNKKIVLFVLCFVLFFIIGCSKSGVVQVDGQTKYLNSDGKYVVDDWVKTRDGFFHFDSNGNLQKGTWIDDQYVDENGYMVINKWMEYGNNRIFIKPDGHRATDEIVRIGSSRYAFYEDGFMATSSIIKDSKNTEKYYYFDEEGKEYTTKGLLTFNDDSAIFITDDNSLLTNDWKTIEDKKYHFNDEGMMDKDTLVDGVYYVDENGEMVVDQEIKIDNKKWIFDSNGIGTTSNLKK